MKLFKSALLALAALCAGSTAYATEHMKSLNPDFFDKTTSAGEDFYKFVNQGWMDANQLTPESMVNSTSSQTQATTVSKT